MFFAASLAYAHAFVHNLPAQISRAVASLVIFFKQIPGFFADAQKRWQRSDPGGPSKTEPKANAVSDPAH